MHGDESIQYKMKKATLITGELSGIGLEVCKQLLTDNSDCHVLGLDNSPHEFFTDNSKYTH